MGYGTRLDKADATWTPMEKITSEFMAADNKETFLVLHEPGYFWGVLYLS